MDYWKSLLIIFGTKTDLRTRSRPELDIFWTVLSRLFFIHFNEKKILWTVPAKPKAVLIVCREKTD